MDHKGLQVARSQPPLDPDAVRITEEAVTNKHPTTSQPVLNQYLRGELVGKGQHGEVYLCYDILRGNEERVSASLSVSRQIGHRQSPSALLAGHESRSS